VAVDRELAAGVGEGVGGLREDVGEGELVLGCRFLERGGVESEVAVVSIGGGDVRDVLVGGRTEQDDPRRDPTVVGV